MALPQRETDNYDSDPFQLLEEPLKGGSFLSSNWERYACSLLLALMVNGLLFFAFPWSIDNTYSPRKREIKKALNIQLVEPEILPPQSENYVETNPDVVDNKPDSTENISDRSQQAVQEEVSELVDDTEGSPFIEKGEEEDSYRVVQKELDAPAYKPETRKKVEERKATPGQQAQDMAQALAAKPKQPEFLKNKPVESEDGVRSQSEFMNELLEDVPEDEDMTTGLVEDLDTLGARLEKAQKGETQAQQNGAMPQKAQEGAEVMQPRPRVVRQGAPGPLLKNQRGVSRSGRMAIDANFSEFGDYLARAFDAIGIKWNELNRYGENSLAETSSRVRIQFYITKEGMVEDLEVLFCNASETAKWYCVDAIQGNAPYYEWTKDMVKVLGDRQPVTVTFIYR
jgi:hypothetical protein